jgi:lipopolysaccharide/colanic/teichoic acid biosynthesis glycosyltransferase
VSASEHRSARRDASPCAAPALAHTPVSVAPVDRVAPATGAAFDVKRALDLLAAGCLLALGAPLCLLVGLAITLEDGGPVLFRQTRVGLGGLPFTLYKLRSMRRDAEAESGPQWAAINDTRVTRVGRWIRALRIDEIPQAWNVLRGEMSFIGPRPERVESVQLLSDLIPGYERRHLLRPGITGWAQVNQRHSGTVEEARLKHAYDLHYLERRSLRLDARILLRTARIILLGWGTVDHPRR